MSDFQKKWDKHNADGLLKTINHDGRDVCFVRSGTYPKINPNAIEVSVSEARTTLKGQPTTFKYRAGVYVKNHDGVYQWKVRVLDIDVPEGINKIDGAVGFIMMEIAPDLSKIVDVNAEAIQRTHGTDVHFMPLEEAVNY